jgi:hypothetical protein
MVCDADPDGKAAIENRLRWHRNPACLQLYQNLNVSFAMVSRFELEDAADAHATVATRTGIGKGLVDLV